MSPAPKPDTMLDYYVSAGISPVHQDISDLSRHLDRRQALYQSIGLLPSAFAGRSVLEVGPGSGHNSLFVACQRPSRYVLLEPNPKAVGDIEQLYSELTIAHTTPDVICQKLEDFPVVETFDLVICEGWLGSSAHEQAMVTKLSQHVRPGGVLVLTVISPIGLVANTLRKALCLRLTAPDAPLEQRLDIGLQAFSPHLATLASMTRPHRDWLLDMVLSPVYFDICLTPEMAVARLGTRFEALGTQPRFITDWRWYKAIHGDNRGFNTVFLESYMTNCLNFLDYRKEIRLSEATSTRQILLASESLLDATAIWERQYRQFGAKTPMRVTNSLDSMISNLQTSAPDVARALDEARQLLGQVSITPEGVAGMNEFSGLFGRELIYCSFFRNSDDPVK